MKSKTLSLSAQVKALQSEIAEMKKGIGTADPVVQAVSGGTVTKEVPTVTGYRRKVGSVEAGAVQEITKPVATVSGDEASTVAVLPGEKVTRPKKKRRTTRKPKKDEGNLKMAAVAGIGLVAGYLLSKKP